MENAFEVTVAPSELKKMEDVAFDDYPTTPKILLGHCQKFDNKSISKGGAPAVYLIKDKWIVVPKTGSLFKLKRRK